MIVITGIPPKRGISESASLHAAVHPEFCDFYLYLLRKGIGLDDVSCATAENRELNTRQKDFAASLERALSECESKQDRVSALKQFAGLNQDSVPHCQNFDASELMTVFNLLKSNGGFSEMIELFYGCENPTFQKASVVRELLAAAYNKVEPPQPEMALSIAGELIKEGLANGEVFSVMGKAYRLLGDTQRALEHYQKGFEVGFEYYPGINTVYEMLNLGRIDDAQKVAHIVYLACLRDGASESTEYWCVTTRLEAACIMNRDPKEVEECLHRVLAVASSEWQICSTLTTLERAQKVFKEGSLASSEVDRAVNALRERLELVREAEKSPEGKAKLREALDGLTHRVEDLSEDQISCIGNESIKQEVFAQLDRMGVGQLQNNLARLPEVEWREYVAGLPDYTVNAIKHLALMEGSYSFRGMASNFIGGNVISGSIRYGGQLPDHTVSRFDLEQFDQIINRNVHDLIDTGLLTDVERSTLQRLKAVDGKTFLDIARLHDWDLLSDVADIVIRQRFRIPQLEDLHGVDHIVYDALVAGFLEAAGAVERKGTDSRTNLSVAFALGIGDCRQSNMVKQLIFDISQNAVMNESLTRAYEAKLQGNDAAFDFHILACEAVERWQMRTFDAVIMTTALMEQRENPETGLMEDILYRPRRTDDGDLIQDPHGQLHEMEHHTACFLVYRSPDFRESAARVISREDAFYHDTYQLNSRGLSFASLGLIRVDKLAAGDPAKDLGVTMPVPAITAVDSATGEQVSCQVELRPARHAGKRDTPADEYGAPRAIGIALRDFNLGECLVHEGKRDAFYTSLLTSPAAREILEKHCASTRSGLRIEISGNRITVTSSADSDGIEVRVGER